MRNCHDGICINGVCTDCPPQHSSCDNECASELSHSPSQGDIIDLGLPMRHGTIYSGVRHLPGPLQEHWFKVSFIYNVAYTAVPRIEFETNEGQLFSLAVFRATAPFDPVPCVEGSVADQDYFRFEDGCAYCDATTPPTSCSTPRPEPLLIRVTRKHHLPVCAKYQLVISG